MNARNASGHGCLVWAALLPAALAAAAAAEPITVTRPDFHLDYEVKAESRPLESVVLWYTTDRGATWQRYGEDPDRRPPIAFHAETEGLYGFFLVAENGTGPSSNPPTETTTPHAWVLVDYTPPIVQLHPPVRGNRTHGPTIQIRWTAVDDHLAPRPIEITYRLPPDGPWQSVSSDPIANTGRYDWHLRDHISGPVAIRVAARDRVGHVTHSDPITIEPARSEPAASNHADVGATPASARLVAGEAAPPWDTALPGTARAKARASRLCEQAKQHALSGQDRRAISLLRDAARLDPANPAVFAELGAALYRVGDLDRALDAYELALAQEPSFRAALRGSAMVLRQKNDLEAAAKRLRTILRYNPNDAEVWMNLGDVAVFQGDEVLARECYTRASQIDPEATEVVAAARKRLELMRDVARQYEARGR